MIFTWLFRCQQGCIHLISVCQHWYWFWWLHLLRQKLHLAHILLDNIKDFAKPKWISFNTIWSLQWQTSQECLWSFSLCDRSENLILQNVLIWICRSTVDMIRWPQTFNKQPNCKDLDLWRMRDSCVYSGNSRMIKWQMISDILTSRKYMFKWPGFNYRQMWIWINNRDINL